MTQAGDPVCDLDSSHTSKRPYETLIVGRLMTTDEPLAECIQLPAEHRVIVSVPCSIHSRKPPLASQFISSGCPYAVTGGLRFHSLIFFCFTFSLKPSNNNNNNLTCKVPVCAKKDFSGADRDLNLEEERPLLRIETNFQRDLFRGFGGREEQRHFATFLIDGLTNQQPWIKTLWFLNTLIG